MVERISAAVHLDLDGGAHVFRAHGWRYEAAADPLFETGLRTALDFFDEAGVRATLFVIAEDLALPFKRELIRDAVRRGHDIASHSLTHRDLTTLGRAEKWREIFESRERLAQSMGHWLRRFWKPECISALIARACARTSISAGQPAPESQRSLTNSSIASESQTTSSPRRNTGTRPVGDHWPISAKYSGVSRLSLRSSKAMSNCRSSSHGRSDHEE